MAKTIALRGPVARNDRQLAKLRIELQSVSSDIQRLYAEFVHVIWLEDDLSPEDLSRLHEILAYHSVAPRQDLEMDYSCAVYPRVGTISPWSSKASDIVQLCGLNQISRVERGVRWWLEPWNERYKPFLHDRMTEDISTARDLNHFEQSVARKPLVHVQLGKDPLEALRAENQTMGLALLEPELEYLAGMYGQLNRDPTDVELMMFAQANSEHCRHKIFNAPWLIDGVTREGSLFDFIRNTTAVASNPNILSAYKDNAAVIRGTTVANLQTSEVDHNYQKSTRESGILMKVETHNHPTAIAPFPGAATGSGGEIRDESAVGRGSKPKAGLVGYTVSNLRIPGLELDWEEDLPHPKHMATPLTIMLEGPLGAAGFNNEYGRPCLTGYFRSFEWQDSDGRHWGYHKPVMIAGGLGSVSEIDVLPEGPADDVVLVVIGGPAMLIGLGGGAASSMSSSGDNVELDFASVQRDNPEMQRRCQEVIDRCTHLGNENPIRWIHDVGAGGLANALPELVNDLHVGGTFELRNIPVADPNLSPMEIWANESQERFVLALHRQRLKTFESICDRERCPYAVVGSTNVTHLLTVMDQLDQTKPVDMPLQDLLGNPPTPTMSVTRSKRRKSALQLPDLTFEQVVDKVLSHPSVASKKFLVTIGDRSITGLVSQEQMVGPYQVPVGDAAVTISDFDSYSGEVMAIGERSPVAVIDPIASVQLAVAEALTNLSGVYVGDLANVVLSANWMAAADLEQEKVALYDAVREIGEEFCTELGIAIPVGKDSLSMRTQWEEDSLSRDVVSPVTLIVSAFCAVPDVRTAVTPQLCKAGSYLLLLSLDDQKRMSGSIVAQTLRQLGDSPPRVEPKALRSFFNFIQTLIQQRRVLALHDRSDGGAFVSCCEMAFAGKLGIELTLDNGEWIQTLFNEEVGVVVEVEPSQVEQIHADARIQNLHSQVIGKTTEVRSVVVKQGDELLFDRPLSGIEKQWNETSFAMQALRDDDTCAREELDDVVNVRNYLRENLTYDPAEQPEPFFASTKRKPKVAILRDQGVNGELEMAAAFMAAGFDCVDVHMTDLFSNSVSLDDFQVLAACGGFSYGDVLGGGGGWAKTILYNEAVREQFERFFQHDRLTLGICNGCQMLSQLKQLIPGSHLWPAFVRNRSDRFEGRTVQLKIEQNQSPWLENMVGSIIPIVVAHGEGQASFADDDQRREMQRQRLVASTYCSQKGQVVSSYPWNPNGSSGSIAGVTSADGKVLIMMPHPERVFRQVQNTWIRPMERNREPGAWLRLFQNAANALR